MAKHGKRKQREIKARAERRVAYVAAIKRAKESPGSLVPSKYRLRQEARKRGEPMAARPFAPWWGALSFPKAVAP